MKKILSCLAILLLCVQVAQAQPGEEKERTANNALYATLFGYTGLFGVGYERLLSPNLGLNIGFTSLEIDIKEEVSGSQSRSTLTLIPVFLSFYSGEGSSRFFIEAGLEYAKLDGNSDGMIEVVSGDGIIGIGGIGYNYNPLDGGVFFKIGANIFFNPEADEDEEESPVFFFAGLSLGFSF